MIKNTLFLVLFSIGFFVYSQTKENGVIYAEHPSISVVESMQQAFVAGNIEKVGSYLTEDFKELNGSKMDSDSKGANKTEYLEYVKFWSENISDMRIERQERSFPDAIQYKGDSGGVWVQTWDLIKGVDKFSKDKINLTIHSMYRVTKENKIKTIINYYDDSVVSSIGRNESAWREQMLIQNHEYINSVKMAFAAFESSNLEKAYSVFDEDAVFRDLTMKPNQSSQTLNDFKSNNSGFLREYDIVSIAMNGSPDLVRNKKNNSTKVQSWWTFVLRRKADNKKMEIPAMYSHTFNESGKIVRTKSYVDLDLFDAEW